VVAASTPDQNEGEWAAENLQGVQIFQDYDEMLEQADLEAVVIASITAVHAEQALKAIKKGLHVLCEKPLSIDVEVVCWFATYACEYLMLKYYGMA
jgi:myo-inositol 2-dehydrogenase/D-chiro-inositol 1-dehydrogenase